MAYKCIIEGNVIALSSYIDAIKREHQDGSIRSRLEDGNPEMEESGNSLLHTACRCGNPAAALLLLKHGYHVDDGNQDGQTALMIACGRGNNDTVLAILQRAQNLDALDSSLRPALWYAASRCPIHVCRAILDAGASVFVPAEPQPGQSCRDPLNQAILTSREPELIKLFLDYGAPVDVPDYYHGHAIHNASAFHGSVEAIDLLLEAGADPESRIDNGLDALGVAIGDQRLDLVQHLLSKGVTVKSKPGSITHLHQAVADGTPEIMDLLLQHGADVNVKGLQDETPLHWALRYYCPDNVKMLLASGARVNAINALGMFPIHYALQRRDLRWVGILLKRGSACPPLLMPLKIQSTQAKLARCIAEYNLDIPHVHFEADPCFVSNSDLGPVAAGVKVVSFNRAWEMETSAEASRMIRMCRYHFPHALLAILRVYYCNNWTDTTLVLNAAPNPISLRDYGLALHACKGHLNLLDLVTVLGIDEDLTETSTVLVALLKACIDIALCASM